MYKKYNLELLILKYDRNIYQNPRNDCIFSRNKIKYSITIYSKMLCSVFVIDQYRHCGSRAGRNIWGIHYKREAAGRSVSGKGKGVRGFCCDGDLWRKRQKAGHAGYWFDIEPDVPGFWIHHMWWRLWAGILSMAGQVLQKRPTDYFAAE